MNGYRMKMPVNLSPSAVKKFQHKILEYYRLYGRQMPWRETHDPYRVLVSEIMLQQTQVTRVEKKYEQFLAAFPDFSTLAEAPLSKVYAVWQGLGYNRRALSLKKAARVVVTDHAGVLPRSGEALEALPGIGKATASSIMAFAFDLPVVFVETNIRTVFIHCFFKKKKLVSDDEIFPLVERCLYRKAPRIWYWALMDYGAMLKKSGEDKNEKSRHYVKQGRFEGSRRQLRGIVLRSLLSKSYTFTGIRAVLPRRAKDEVLEILVGLEKEGFILKSGGKYELRERVD
jgi:A/G-specific adenine glycosylase